MAARETIRNFQRLLKSACRPIKSITHMLNSITCKKVAEIWMSGFMHHTVDSFTNLFKRQNLYQYFPAVHFKTFDI